MLMPSENPDGDELRAFAGSIRLSMRMREHIPPYEIAALTAVLCDMMAEIRDKVQPAPPNDNSGVVKYRDER